MQENTMDRFKVSFDSMEHGMCVEILHVGPFDDEPESFQKMDGFTALNGLKRSEKWHCEIYLNNAKRVLPGKLKTILRYHVEESL